jgi:hypothetical protein
MRWRRIWRFSDARRLASVDVAPTKQPTASSKHSFFIIKQQENNDNIECRLAKMLKSTMARAATTKSKRKTLGQTKKKKKKNVCKRFFETQRSVNNVTKQLPATAPIINVVANVTRNTMKTQRNPSFGIDWRYLREKKKFVYRYFNGTTRSVTIM